MTRPLPLLRLFCVVFSFLMWAGFAKPIQAQDIRLEGNPTLIRGPLQVRFAFTDQNGAQQDLTLQQLPTSTFNTLPASLQQAKSSVLLQGQAKSFFDQLWDTIRGNVCGEIMTQITADINTSDNSAYNVNCTTNAPGALAAMINT